VETIHTDKEGKLAIFGNTKQVIQDYHTAFDNSIPFRKNDLQTRNNGFKRER
jgi:hypothetical protein